MLEKNPIPHVLKKILNLYVWNVEARLRNKQTDKYLDVLLWVFPASVGASSLTARVVKVREHNCVH